MSVEQDAHFVKALTKIVRGTHHNPHAVLGLHPYFNDQKVIRLWRPGASEIFVELFGEVRGAKKIEGHGVFEIIVPKETTFKDYRVYHAGGLLANDPYAFLPTFGELDQHLFCQGVHYELYNALGSQETVVDGVLGVKFAVWAPSALGVSLVGDFNFWDGRVSPMRSMGYSGVWELFVPGLKEGERYKFEIKTQEGENLIKSDPYVHGFEKRPRTASIVTNVNRYEWQDEAWIQERALSANDAKPMLIYELHMGSWRNPHGEPLSYRQLALELAAYCKEMGFTHVELLPVAEHPLDESWGYQVVGFFAPTSRFGELQDFQFFVDYLHQEGIGVLLDWVPAHFPNDDFSLAYFDGTALYEHADPRQGFHPHWNTHIFNYGRLEVSNFLIASALFWLEVMHIDGLRVDAVASMLYLDYGREEGGWVPNAYGGKENLEAIEFIKHLNAVVHERLPGVLTIAEESTSFAGVTKPVEWEGLGFDYKWNMGWMNDTLRYFKKDPLYRRYHQNDLTFGLLYAFTEKFILALSHDEVVHGKGSLLSKMPGDMWQKCANLRLLYSYMLCHPGKKLVFMGGELGQVNEWWCKEEIHWHLLQYPHHLGIQTTIREMNHFLLSHKELWEQDEVFSGFEWVDFSDQDNSIIAYRRKAQEEEELLCIHNFTPNTHQKYFLSLQNLSSVKEVFNTDAKKYGGSGQENNELHPTPEGLALTIAPLATQVFKIQF